VTDWNPALYRRFEGERTRPAMDLLARVPLSAATKVVDIGCGPGNSTELLAARYPEASLSGIDTSNAMVETARTRLPRARFEVADIALWTPDEPVDLLFANATLQWVTGHRVLLPRLAAQLAPGGALAIQMPDNLHTPMHTLMREAALAVGRADVVAQAEAERETLGSFEDYWGWLSPHAASIDIWKTTYVHPLADHDAIVTWLESTGLRPYLNRLTPDEIGRFKAHYRDAIARAYPAVSDGKVLLRFPRLFIVAMAADSGA
jgi:trans-aconitate 2-methyltransferase